MKSNISKEKQLRILSVLLCNIAEEFTGTAVTPENMFDSLGLDSLDMVEIVMSLEEELDVEIPDELAENIGNSRNKTVAEVAEMLAKYCEHNLIDRSEQLERYGKQKGID